MINSLFTTMLSVTILTACSEDNFGPDPAKDWAGTTTFFAPTDDAGFNTYYMPAIGRCGDPMPFYDQKAGEYKVLYLQEASVPRTVPTTHPSVKSSPLAPAPPCRMLPSALAAPSTTRRTVSTIFITLATTSCCPITRS